MRAVLPIFAGLLLAACQPIEPSFDAEVQGCRDASVGVCLRGPAGACDFRFELPPECGVVPPCGCACPAGYVPREECGEP